jgi:hypothetical protein
MKIRLLFVFVILASLVRLGLHFLPTPPANFSPIGAIGLFGAAYFSRRWMAFFVPFAALFLTDLILNNVLYAQYYPSFTWFTSVWSYASFALVILAGFLILNTKKTPLTVLGASLSASLIFFLVSNFGVWASSGMYGKSIFDLLMCYVAGLPFLGNTVMGDLFFSALMFGSFEWVMRRNVVPQAA